MAGNDWLRSIPFELATDITDNPIDGILADFREALPEEIYETASMDVDMFENLLHQEGDNPDPSFPLSALLNHLAFTPVASRWKSDMTRGRPSLARDILALGVDFLSSNLLQDKTRLRSCASLLSLAAGGASGTTIWKTIFEIFEPAQYCPTPDVLSTNSAVGSTPASYRSSRPMQTPVKYNSGSFMSESSTHATIDGLIRAELEGLVFPNTPRFIETYFPTNPTVTEAYQWSARHRSTPGNTWQDWPAPPVEAPVLSWFLQLTDELLKQAGSSRRYFSSSNKPLSDSTTIRRADLFLYPSDTAPSDDRFSWSKVLVVCEVKQSHTPEPSVAIVVQLAGYVREVFAAQNHRRFVHAFTLCGDFMRCWLFHRGGVVGSTEFNINEKPDMFIAIVMGYAVMSESQLGFDTTLDFSSMGMELPGCHERFTVVEQAFFYRSAIASRGTTCWDAVGVGSGVRYVLKDSWRSDKYANEGVLLARVKEMGVRGIVEYVGHEDVLADGVLDDVLGNIMKGLNVAKPMKLRYPAADGVMFNPYQGVGVSPVSAPTEGNTESVGPGKVIRIGLTARPSWISTSRSSKTSSEVAVPRSKSTQSSLPATYKRRGSDRPILSSRNSNKRRNTSGTTTTCPQFNRIHTRLLMVKGQPIYRFTSILQLIQATHDAIVGHHSLFTHGILHRDISINNIMITPGDQPRHDGMQGFLIDLDLAVELSSIKPSGSPHRTGTMEFMAIGALEGEIHTYRHDLESFFYVFIWICLNYTLTSGPARHCGRNKTITDGWSSHNYEMASTFKGGSMSVGAFGFDKVLFNFEGWASGLKGLARQWRDVLFPVRNGEMWLGTDEDYQPLYSNILALLEGTVAELKRDIRPD